MSEPQDLPAGTFSSWLRTARIALATNGAVDVPCGDCTACCTSSYFVHIRANEGQTLARIPPELRFAAPDLPRGNVVLGYDEMGQCPMLRDGACSIYEDRPLTCRTYDCRVFAAAGIAADREAIAARSRRWAFDHPDPEDRDQHAAVQAAARFIQQHAARLPCELAPQTPAQAAVLAVKVGDLFLGDGDAPSKTGRATGRAGDLDAAVDAETAAAIMRANEDFEASRASCPGPPEPA